MHVIGTAGHVDHGKSTLVHALTGIDPDRLREEKERGLTIDLGFAWLREEDGEEVGIVDVPGHERFIKNMLAGVGGIDLALLVIAADEGVMPQTREHLAIIDLLGIEHGVVALTKSDLAEPDFLDLAEAEIAETLAGTTLAEAPIVRCSATTRAGLEELRAAIRRELGRTQAKRDIGRPRLPIDRAFTMAGFGTVVTGTLIDGSLKVGQEVELVPGGLKSRVRGLQSHGKTVETAGPGRRTAVNLTGLAVEEVRRGMVVVPPGQLRPTLAFDARVRAVGYLDRPVKHNLNVTVHTGSAEVDGKLLLLDGDALRPGESAFAQLRLAEPLAAVSGDRFIIRDPNDTLAGGRMLDTDVRRHRRYHEPTLAALTGLEHGSPAELIAAAAARLEPAEARAVIAASGLDAAVAASALRDAVASGEVVSLDEELSDGALLYSRAGFEALSSSVVEALTTYHRAWPLRRGMPREELRNRLGLPARAFDRALARLSGIAEERGATVGLPGHVPALDATQQTSVDGYLAALRANPFAPAVEQPPDELLSHLEEEGAVVRAAEGVVFASEAYGEMVQRIEAHLREHKTVTLAQVRDMFSTSRKFAQALLEHMDSKHITRRVGDERTLR